MCFVGYSFGVLSFIEIAAMVFLAYYIWQLQKDVDRYKNVVDTFMMDTNTPRNAVGAETTDYETKKVKRPSNISMTPTGSKHKSKNSTGSSKLIEDGSITVDIKKKKKAKDTPKREQNKVVSKTTSL